MTPMQAIRAKCLDCCLGSANEVKLCPMDDCSLYEYRFGKNPHIKREYTDAQRQAMRENLSANLRKKTAKPED